MWEILLKTEANFNLWMDINPEFESWQHQLDTQKAHNEVVYMIRLRPKTIQGFTKRQQTAI